jgi:hypothetical protein
MAVVEKVLFLLPRELNIKVKRELKPFSLCYIREIPSDTICDDQELLL